MFRQLADKAPTINKGVAEFGALSVLGGAIGAGVSALLGGDAALTTLGLRAAPAAATAGATIDAVQRVVEESGGSIQQAIQLGNSAGLTQGQSIQAIRTVLTNTGRGDGGLFAAGQGAQIILPRLGGPNAPIVQVGADGVAKFGTAAVRFSFEGGKIVGSASNIRIP